MYKGLSKDNRPITAIDGQARHCKNYTMSLDNKSIFNEDGYSFSSSHEFPVIGIISLPNGYIVFSAGYTGTELSGDFTNWFKIEKVIDGVKTTILRTEYLNYTRENPIEGVYKYNNKQEIIIYFWDGVNETSNRPSSINIDDLPFSIDANYEIDSANPEDDIELIRMSPKQEFADIVLSKLENSGGEIQIGSYYFMIAYCIDDDNITSWSLPSNPILVIEQSNDTESNGSGVGSHNITKTSGFINKTIHLTIDNLDQSYTKFKLAYVLKSDNAVDVTECKLVGTYAITDTYKNLIFNGTTEGTLTLNELTISPLGFDKIKTGTVANDKLIVANAIEGIDLDYQKYANNIKLGWIAKELGTEEERFSDTSLDCFFNKSLLPDEVYAFYIHWVLKDGRITKGYHIPGRESRDYELATNVTIVGYISRDIETLAGLYNIPIPSDDNSIYTYLESISWTLPSNAYIVIRGKKIPIKSMSSGYISILASSIYIYAVEDLSRIKGALVIETSETVSENDLLSDWLDYAEYNGKELDISSNIKVFHTRDTSDDLTSSHEAGSLGYWENENETYPDDPSSEIWDVDVDGIGFYTDATLANSKIRHHKMPNISKMYDQFDEINKTLGITISDIKIPSELLSRVQGYVISYAKRTYDNCTILGYGLMKGDKYARFETDSENDKYIRFHDPVLMQTKNNINPDYVKAIYNIERNLIMEEELIDTIYGINNFAIDILNINPIDKVNYIPAHNSVTTPINTNREEALIITLKDTINGNAIVNYLNLGQGDIDETGINYRAYYYAGVLVKHKDDAYYKVNDQELVLTNSFTRVSLDTYSYSNSEVYGFDTFVTKQIELARTLTSSGEITDPALITWFKSSYYTLFNNRFINLDFTIIASPSVIHLERITDIGYNEALSAINNVKIVLPFDYSLPINLTFPYRVYASLSQATESLYDGWRVFLPTNYHESIRNKGVIWKILFVNKALLIQFEFSTFIAKIKDTLEVNNTTAYLGTGDLFSDANGNPVLLEELIATDYGYIGNRSQFSTFSFSQGAFMIDISQGKLFIFNSGIQEISKPNKLWFKNNLIANTLDKTFDNPYFLNGVCANYDEENERLIICKRSLTFKSTYRLTTKDALVRYHNEVWLDANKIYLYTVEGEIETITEYDMINDTLFDISYKTLTFKAIENNFLLVSEHDYCPNYIFQNRFGTYLVNNDIEILGTETNTYKNIIYKHNNKDVKGIYEEYIKGYDENTNTFETDKDLNNIVIPKESYIDLIFNNPPDLYKLFKSVEWKTDVIDKNGVVRYDNTITGIMLYNDNQCSGIIDVKNNTLWYNKSNGVLVGDTWSFNNFKDIITNNILPFLNTDGSVISNNLSTNKMWYNRSYFISNYIVVRLICNNVPIDIEINGNTYEDFRKININDVNVKFIQQER